MKNDPVALLKVQQMPLFSNTPSGAPGVPIVALMKKPEKESPNGEGDEDRNRLGSSHVMFPGARTACLMW